MEPVAFIQEYKYAFVIAHVLSVVLGMGSALVTDILSFKYGFDKKLSRFEVNTIRFLSHVVTLGLIAILCTGALVFLSDPARYMASVKFLTKMSIVSILTINGIVLHQYVFKHLGDPNVVTSRRSRTVRRVGFACGAISVVSWISALGLGVLLHIPISYGTAISIYAVVVTLAVIASQLLEVWLLERRRKSSI